MSRQKDSPFNGCYYREPWPEGEAGVGSCEAVCVRFPKSLSNVPV